MALVPMSIASNTRSRALMSQGAESVKRLQRWAIALSITQPYSRRMSLVHLHPGLAFHVLGPTGLAGKWQRMNSVCLTVT